VASGAVGVGLASLVVGFWEAVMASGEGNGRG